MSRYNHWIDQNSNRIDRKWKSVIGLNENIQMCFKSRKVVKYELQGIQKNQELSPTQPTNSKSRVWLAATSVS